MGYKVVIPARYASTRLPGKPLLEINGWPMIQHVHQRAIESGADEIVIATDDQRIESAVEAFGAKVVMTSSLHQSGADRIAEVVAKLDWPAETIVVNLQGDEPCMPPQLLDQVATDMATHMDAAVTTLSNQVKSKEMLFDPHVVKIVTDSAGYALYFSRAPIPWHRDEFNQREDQLPVGVSFLQHIGIYAYRASFLERFVNWPVAPVEQAESLEQLRVLWHGERIHVSQATQLPGQGVDTMNDLQKATEQLSYEN